MSFNPVLLHVTILAGLVIVSGCRPSGEVLAEFIVSSGAGYDIQLHENGSLKLFAPTRAWLYDGTLSVDATEALNI